MRYIFQKTLWLCCVVLNGCIVIANYPASWAPLETAQQDCFSINGIYKNEGLMIEPMITGDTERTAYLSRLLLKEWKKHEVFILSYTKSIPFFESVKIFLSKDGTLEITAFKSPAIIENDQLFLKKQYSTIVAEYRCENGNIQISQWETGGGEGGIGTGRASLTLSKSTDGSLIVKVSAFGIGVTWFLIPIAGGGVEWYRFEPYLSDKPNS